MTYTKQIWVDHNPAYPVSAARMLVIEQGIYDASVRPIPLAVAYGTSLPASPADGQEGILVDSLTNPTYQWRFRYNAGSSSAYKWEFVGGSPRYASVNPSQSSTVTGSWIDLATVGPELILPRNGDYLALAGAGLSHSVAGGEVYIGICPGAAGPILPVTRTKVPAAGGVAIATIQVRALAVTGASGLRLRYDNETGGTMSAESRWLSVVPIRVA